MLALARTAPCRILAVVGLLGGSLPGFGQRAKASARSCRTKPAFLTSPRSFVTTWSTMGCALRPTSAAASAASLPAARRRHAAGMSVSMAFVWCAFTLRTANTWTRPGSRMTPRSTAAYILRGRTRRRRNRSWLGPPQGSQSRQRKARRAAAPGQQERRTRQPATSGAKRPRQGQKPDAQVVHRNPTEQCPIQHG